MTTTTTTTMMMTMMRARARGSLRPSRRAMMVFLRTSHSRGETDRVHRDAITGCSTGPTAKLEQYQPARTRVVVRPAVFNVTRRRPCLRGTARARARAPLPPPSLSLSHRHALLRPPSVSLLSRLPLFRDGAPRSELLLPPLSLSRPPFRDLVEIHLDSLELSNCRRKFGQSVAGQSAGPDDGSARSCSDHRREKIRCGRDPKR